MRKNNWGYYVAICLIVGATGLFVCNSLEWLPTEAFANPNKVVPQGKSGVVPDWLAEDVRSRFSDTAKHLVKKELITVAQVRMKSRTAEGASPPELAAYLTLDRLNGVFVLYAYEDGGYRPVYTRAEPVYGLQIIGGGEYLVLTSGYGGTGIQENKLFVIRRTADGYREVWSGIAHKHKAGETVDVIEGNVQFDLANDTMLYFSLERSMDSAGATLMEKSSYELLRYNEKTMRFEK
jgi:hypothetical protein